MMTLFFLLLILLIYIYFLYPLVLSLKRVDEVSGDFPSDTILPFVSIIVPAYNEEKQIVEKLQNTFAQDYPKDRYEILVTSDGSTDATVALAKALEDKRVRVIENTERKGKNHAINKALTEVRGEILVFTDANALFSTNALTKLVNPFGDPTVGLVCGRLHYLKGEGTHVGKGEGLYFRYESWIKRQESRWGAVSVVTGAIYAIRRELATLLEPDVANDFAHPVQVGSKGYKVVFEPDAVALERATESLQEEFHRRVRIVTRGFTAFGKYWKKYGLLQGKRGFCFVSHKLLRWFAPIFLLGLFLSNLFLLENAFFLVTLWAQVLFYVTAVFGIFVKRRIPKILVIPFYFCMINLAALVGFFLYLRGKRQSVWNVAASTR